MSDHYERWEARTARRAAARAVGQKAADPDPHDGHHSHLQGTSVWCSCGEWGGVTCVAFDEETITAEWWEAQVCSMCGKHGVVKLDEKP